MLVGPVAATDVFSGRWPEAGPPGPGPVAWPGAAGRTTAPSSPIRTAPTRTAPARAFGGGPPLHDGPSAEPLPGATPDAGRPLPASAENSGAPANGHDPNEVTVQLGGVSLRARGTVQPGKNVSAAGEASEGPVFVDASGRRSRRFRRLGMLVAVACAVYAVVIVATLLSGNSNAPWLPVPGQEEDMPAGQVKTSPLPTQPVKRSGTRGATAPRAVATAGGGVRPSAGSTASAGASPSATAASGHPKPSASATKKPKPGVTTKSPAPDPRPSSSADGRPTAPVTATTPAGTAAPTETAGTPGSTGAGAAPNE
ncbi:hypothetical protein ACH4S8_38460 [Streptomyces sp. NPDC021080]|uniref:hypothetical protein n=1 Tax=Streptomyces sp. NPDC021080 TaxID=3365110 RepID=UPI00378CA924